MAIWERLLCTALALLFIATDSNWTQRLQVLPEAAIEHVLAEARPRIGAWLSRITGGGFTIALRFDESGVTVAVDSLVEPVPLPRRSE